MKEFFKRLGGRIENLLSKKLGVFVVGAVVLLPITIIEPKTGAICLTIWGCTYTLVQGAVDIFGKK